MEYEFILRIFIAALLGSLIGLEREYRSKEAGFRTHFLVAMGSALFMIVSAYGFQEAMGDDDLQRWDVSRVAAQVVSGIGFIGAGTIIFRKDENVVSGLTTAAGLWVTAAIGLQRISIAYDVNILKEVTFTIYQQAFCLAFAICLQRDIAEDKVSAVVSGKGCSTRRERAFHLVGLDVCRMGIEHLVVGIMHKYAIA